MKFEVINLQNHFSDSIGTDGTTTFTKPELVWSEKIINIKESGKSIHFKIHFNGRIEVLNNFDIPISLGDFCSVLEIINDITFNIFGLKAHLKFN